jgi:aspartokinase-like uncharacterized kinase
MILSASSLRNQGPQRERARVHRYAVKAAIEAGVVSLFIQAMRAGGYGSPEFTNEVQHILAVAAMDCFACARNDVTNVIVLALSFVQYNHIRVFIPPILWGRDERSSLFLIPPHKWEG